ncbi:putative DD41D transposase [Trichonephila inaurata madagascariensis]|uniref:Putative DD41D transposase n=1 Tax=Trichonephila inaurata madagascariensis TaxID=2747483 RepID=A0A8X6YQ11_9ARAC|nr:putative DD41D transposase [Trichonephila inaurata madagascariensis]
MIIDYFWPELEYMDLDSLWFQQDGATSHTAYVTIDLLKNKFDESVISRNGPVDWSPCSCDLTPLDFFFFGARSSHWSMLISRRRWKSSQPTLNAK